ncbi:MAG: methyl-viologen-reducing hydrogenase subunit delta, partial [Deltaproteobacteria bacterium]
EGIDKNELKLNLEAVRKLVPYLKLVERERLRVPVKSEEAYKAFFESSEVDRLFNEIMGDKLAISQILLLLKKEPLSTSDISKKLGLNPSDVSKHMNRSSMHGLVRYDVNRNCYALASV